MDGPNSLVMNGSDSLAMDGISESSPLDFQVLFSCILIFSNTQMNSKFQRSHINDSEMTKLPLERLITNTVHEMLFQEGLNKQTSTRIWIGLSCCRVDSSGPS